MQTKSTRLNLTGQRFGRLIVIEEAPQRGCNRYWLCRCDCGKVSEHQQGSLRNGIITSCGCYAREQRIKGNTTHGATHSREYRSYWGMKQRCYQESSTSKHNYADRGITVCTRWLESFENFLADMGPCPSPTHSIDRIDNDSGYFCGKSECSECGSLNREPNCRWATPIEQCNNKRDLHYFEHDGRRQTATQWARELSLPPHRVLSRIQAGVSIHDALFTPMPSDAWEARRVMQKLREKQANQEAEEFCAQTERAAH